MIKLKEKHSNLLKDIFELTEIKKDLEKKIEEEKPKNEIKDFPKVISFNKGPIIPPSSSSDMFYKKVEDVPKEISFNKGSTIPTPPPPPPSPGTFFKTNSNYSDFLPPIPKLNPKHSYITIKKSKGPHNYSKFDDK